MKLKTKLMIAGLIFLFCFMTYLKVLGSTDLGIDVEKKGYCKQYGKDWKYSENGYCFDKYKTENKVYFTEQEFRDYCPDNKFLSLRLYSKCFFNGDAF